jgi:hypothetical protein
VTTSPPWYEVVNDKSLRQGDIFITLYAFWLPPGIKPPTKPGEKFEVTVEYELADWIILSASCDIDRIKEGHVLFARVFQASDKYLKVKTDTERRERLEVLRRGFDPQRFLLAEHTGKPELPISFVGYRTQVLLPVDYVLEYCKGDRLRMRPPHREKFGAWAGANLGRVGIEDADQIGLPGKVPYIGSAQVLRSVAPE